ncbi:MAG: FIST N-terminal domain-containing protein, partial [Gallionella sp.]
MQLSTYRYTPAGGWENALDPTLDSDKTLLIVFGGSDTDELTPGIVGLREAFPRSVWIGCSTAGEIYGRTIEDDTLVVAVMKFTHTVLRLVTREIFDDKTSFDAGSYLSGALATPGLRAIFVLSDGISCFGSELVNGLMQNVPRGVVVTGGLAGDGD